MRSVIKVICLMLLVAASIVWSVVAFRTIAFVLLLAFLVGLKLRPVAAHPVLFTSLWLAFFAATWLPFDVVALNLPGGPKFVRCCPGVHPVGHQEMEEKQRLGECLACGCQSRQFAPDYFLVW